MHISNFLTLSRLKTIKQQGFSVIEIILVVLIAGFIILLIGNLPSAIKLIGISNHESIAKEIASQEIEKLRSIPYLNISNGTTTVSDSRVNTLPNGSGTVTVEDCPVSICSYNTSPNPIITRQALVVITWSESGKDRNVKITTLISDGGLK